MRYIYLIVLFVGKFITFKHCNPIFLLRSTELLMAHLFVRLSPEVMSANWISLYNAY